MITPLFFILINSENLSSNNSSFKEEYSTPPSSLNPNTSPNPVNSLCLKPSEPTEISKTSSIEICQGCDCLPPQKEVSTNNHKRKKHDLVYDKKISQELLNFLCSSEKCDFNKIKQPPLNRFYQEVTSCFNQSMSHMSCENLLEGPLVDGKREPDHSYTRTELKKIPDLVARNALVNTLITSMEVGNSWENKTTPVSLGNALTIGLTIQNQYRAKTFNQRVHNPMEDYTDVTMFSCRYALAGISKNKTYYNSLQKKHKRDLCYYKKYNSKNRSFTNEDSDFYRNYKNGIKRFCPKIVNPYNPIIQTNILATLLQPLVFDLIQTDPQDFKYKAVGFRGDLEMKSYINNKNYSFVKNTSILLGKESTSLHQTPSGVAHKKGKINTYHILNSVDANLSF